MGRRLAKKTNSAEDVFASLLDIIPATELEDPGLDIRNTPARVHRMMRDELLASYQPGSFQKLCDTFTCFESDGQDALVFLGSVEFSSMCAHHVLPFVGQAYVAYVPDKKIVGLSKLARVVEHYSRMLQIQERMTRQIADFVFEKAEAKFAVCMLDSAHYCMRCRGVKQQTARMVTTAIRPQPGSTADEAWRGVLTEFYAQVQLLVGRR